MTTTLDRTSAGIKNDLRRKIVNGEYAPGSRLPTRDEMEVMFKTSRVTIQRAFDGLVRDSFIETDGRRGTFVSLTPPHLTRYAIVFPVKPESDTGFYRACAREAIERIQTPQCKLSLYFEVNGFVDSDDYRQLLYDVANHCLAGIIFASNSERLKSTPLFADSEMPIVAIESRQSLENVPIVYPDIRSFIQKGVEYLRNQGKKRLAIMMPNDYARVYDRESPGVLREYLANSGIETRPYWIQRFSLAAPDTARECAELMFHDGLPERPDALIITDDTLVEPVTSSIATTNLRVPRDLEIVAHCNFGYPPPSSTPVVRLGFDVKAVLQACIGTARDMREKKSVPSARYIEAMFESESDRA